MNEGAIVSYVHNAVAPGLGKIGVLVALESAADRAQLETLGKQLAMHIAAASPLAMTGDALDPAIVERERGIAREKAAESGKPAEIVEKMVEGAMAKFRKENALLSQLFVIDNKTKNYITASTLTQLLYESEKKAKTQPSVDLLKEIIRHGDGSFSGFIQAKLGTEFARFDEAPAATAARDSEPASGAAFG